MKVLMLRRKRKLTKKQQAELLRKTVDTIGKIGETRRANTECHFRWNVKRRLGCQDRDPYYGLRAFTSQLLCEQVVGRGLRRTSYDVGSDGLFEPEYVNIFGVPFTFLPHEDKGDGTIPPPPPPKTRLNP